MTLLWVWLVTGADGRWRPGIGDPTFMGWFTVLAYMVSAYFCYRARKAARLGAQSLRAIAPDEADSQRLLARFWLALFVLMLLLGINKQLDLQTFLTQTLRDLARTQGWYEHRRPLQVAFVLLVGLGGLTGSAASAYWLRRVATRVLGALVGIALVGVFVVVRAASFHHVDQLLYGTGPVRLNWVLELSAIAVVGVSAFRAAAPLRGATG